MRWLALSVVGSLILLFATAAGLAEEQSNAPKGNAATVPTVTEPNQQAAPAGLQQQQREQIHQQRQQIRQGIGPYDANALPSVRRRMGSHRGATPNDVNQQPPQSIEQLMATEEAKHLDRVARLNRIHELAQQQGNTELAARAEKVTAREQQLYNAKLWRMERRKGRDPNVPPNPNVNRQRSHVGLTRDGNQITPVGR